MGKYDHTLTEVGSKVRGPSSCIEHGHVLLLQACACCHMTCCSPERSCCVMH
jgi:hypothetical protein